MSSKIRDMKAEFTEHLTTQQKKIFYRSQLLPILQNLKAILVFKADEMVDRKNILKNHLAL